MEITDTKDSGPERGFDETTDPGITYYLENKVLGGRLL
jgi:hypothetical protein